MSFALNNYALPSTGFSLCLSHVLELGHYSTHNMFIQAHNSESSLRQQRTAAAC